MRLLLVGTGAGVGGIETHFVTLARALADGHDQVAALVRPGSDIARWLEGSEVTLMPGAFRNSLDPRGLAAVVRALRAFRPDWIVGSDSKEYWPLVLAGRVSGVPVALFKHMDFEMRPLTKRFIPRLAQRFIVVSEAMRRSFVARGLPPERIDVVPNPIDTGHFRADPELRAEARRNLGYAESDVVVAYLGRLAPEKGVYALADALDRAIPRAPGLRSLWVGSGPHRDAVAARLRATPCADRHRLLPFMPDVRPVYAAADIVAMPSIIAESFGRVAAEAEACGLPVLASAVGGIPETVEDGVTGRLLPPGDAGAWADALVELARDAGLRERMGGAGPALVQARFAAPAVARTFHDLLRRRSARPPRLRRAVAA